MNYAKLEFWHQFENWEHFENLEILLVEYEPNQTIRSLVEYFWALWLMSKLSICTSLYGFIHLKWLPIFEFPKIWKIALRIFQIFEKPFSNFEFCFEKYVKQYLDAYIFGGKCASHSQLMNSVTWLIQCNAHFPQKLQASKYWFLQCSNILIGKFKIGRGLFENFGKLEDGFSKFSNIPIFGRNQMNEPIEYKGLCKF